MGPRHPQRQQGFTYWLALFLVAAVALASLRAMERAQTRAQRDREAELLFVGQAIQMAIQRYYETSPGVLKELPSELDELLLDQRASTTRRPLRRVYRDPLTGSADWGLVRTPEGRIQGVYSKSRAVPLRRTGFPRALQSFESAQTYQDWKFIYLPRP